MAQLKSTVFIFQKHSHTELNSMYKKMLTNIISSLSLLSLPSSPPSVQELRPAPSQGQHTHVKKGQKGHPRDAFVGRHILIRHNVAREPDHPRVLPVSPRMDLVIGHGRRHKGSQGSQSATPLDDNRCRSSLPKQNLLKKVKGRKEEERVADQIHTTNLADNCLL